MDTEFPVNVGHVTRVVDEEEVFIIGFMLFPERLLVDARATPEEGPLVRVVPGVASVDERYETLRQMRPNFPLPERLFFFMWPRSVLALDRFNIRSRIVGRLEALGFGVKEDCDMAFRELASLEQLQMAAAVKGQGYQSIWESLSG